MLLFQLVSFKIYAITKTLYCIEGTVMQII